MRLENFSISDLENLCRSINVKNVPLKDINKYFYRRCEDKVLYDDEEMKEIKDFLEFLKSKCFDSKYSSQIKKIERRANDLMELTKENKELIKQRQEIENLKKTISKCKNKSSILHAINYLYKLIDQESFSIKKLLTIIKDIEYSLNADITDREFEIIDKTLQYLKNDKLIADKIDDFSKYDLVKNRIKKLEERIKVEKEENVRVKNALDDGKIELRRDFPYIVTNSKEMFNERLELSKDRIITLDSLVTGTFDGGFSVKKESGYYVFDVFVTDVPTYLKDNRLCSIEAYKRGVAIDIPNKSALKSLRIHMLPFDLIKNNFSLVENKLRIAIDFKFIIDENGEVKFDSITRKKIRVNKNLDFDKAQMLVDSKDDISLVQRDLKWYKEMVEKVVAVSNNKNIKEINVNNMVKLNSFASLLVNFYIGENANFAIYRSNGAYVKRCEDNYTQSVTPLRRYVSNINLAFFLNQKGVVRFNRKDLNYVENNLEEILAHLNDKNRIRHFAAKNPEYIKKYIK